MDGQKYTFCILDIRENTEGFFGKTMGLVKVEVWMGLKCTFCISDIGENAEGFRRLFHKKQWDCSRYGWD